MRMFPVPLIRTVFAVTAVTLVSCTGARPGDADSAPIPRTDPTSGEMQDPAQDPQERSAAQVRQGLQRARRAMELKLWRDAAQEASLVLEIDQNNEEARSILNTAAQQLGDDELRTAFDDNVILSRISQERDRFRARQEMQLADALAAEGRFGDAVEKYERASLILQFNPFIEEESELSREVRAKLEDARQMESRAMQDAEAARLAASQRERDEAERQATMARQSRVVRLLEQANRDFQIGNYDNSIAVLDQALTLEPNSGEALALRDLAGRAQHENQLDVLRARWASEWTKTFDELNQGMLPQSQTLKYDLERWAEVSQRRPIDFGGAVDLETPEERAILAKLRDTRLEHRFPNATVQDWAKFYQDITGVNFIISPDVVDLDEDATTLTDFDLSTRSVHDALEVIGIQTGVRWRLRDGVVELVSADNAAGRTYLRQYEVRDIVLGVPNNPGPDLKLKIGDEDEAFSFDDEEPPPTVVDDGTLQDLIRENIAVDTWDGEVGTLSYLNGVLLVNHTKEVHEQVDTLLGDLRQAVGIQVDVEARFLKVEDNFLEDIGVDFRGLGDQAADGIPGRGLENRPSLNFDDFGRPELINTASPGTIGTGTEPGVFFDDGGDGDLMGRTENLFDSTLGGAGLDNAGGLSLQYAYLDDIELEVILRAVSKQERSEEIVAPRLLIYNNTRSHMMAVRNTTYIRDFDVEIAQNAAVANPVVDVVRDGVVLDVRPVVSADRRFITMELRPTLLQLSLPIPTFSTTLGAGQPVAIQLPEVTLQRVRTTVTMPDGGTILLGGMKMAERQNLNSGIPVLKDLPGLSLLFSRKGNFVLNRRILILIKATVVLNEEYEPVLLGEEFGQVGTR